MNCDLHVYKTPTWSNGDGAAEDVCNAHLNGFSWNCMLFEFNCDSFFGVGDSGKWHARGGYTNGRESHWPLNPNRYQRHHLNQHAALNARP